MEYIAEFKRRCAAVDAVRYRPIPAPRAALACYHVVKYDGGKRRIIASGMTLKEAAIILKRVHTKVLLENYPNMDGRPYFKLRDYKIELENNSQGFPRIVT